jgi:hypothetical protein
MKSIVNKKDAEAKAKVQLEPGVITVAAGSILWAATEILAMQNSRNTRGPGKEGNFKHNDSKGLLCGQAASGEGKEI